MCSGRVSRKRKHNKEKKNNKKNKKRKRLKAEKKCADEDYDSSDTVVMESALRKNETNIVSQIKSCRIPALQRCWESLQYKMSQFFIKGTNIIKNSKKTKSAYIFGDIGI